MIETQITVIDMFKCDFMPSHHMNPTPTLSMKLHFPDAALSFCAIYTSTDN